MEGSHKLCSRKECGKTIDAHDARIEVCTKLPKRGGSKSEFSKYAVSWNKAGDAIFHPDCWSILIKAARARNKRNSVDLTQTEKSMLKEAAKTLERHDDLAAVKQESKRIAGFIRKARHLCVFTGAGISTSAGIGDYRGKSGKWTEEDRGRCVIETDEPAAKRPRNSDSAEATTSQESDTDEEENEEVEEVHYEKLRPTLTHEALVKLQDMNLLKYVISQNCDGLHLLSGISEDKISELHGNVFVEKCSSCEKRYTRNYYVMDDVASQYYEEIEDHGRASVKKPKHAVKCDRCGLCHRTGRKCDSTLVNGKKCKGSLEDTIINFRDLLENDIMDRAIENARECDVMLCLGTTLQVTPASDLIEMSDQPDFKLIIVNRQKTGMDKECKRGARLFGDCDVIMKEVMSELLSARDLGKWINEREGRLRQYDEKREISD